MPGPLCPKYSAPRSRKPSVTTQHGSTQLRPDSSRKPVLTSYADPWRASGGTLTTGQIDNSRYRLTYGDMPWTTDRSKLPRELVNPWGRQIRLGFHYLPAPTDDVCRRLHITSFVSAQYLL
jgi:hypothetical protein